MNSEKRIYILTYNGDDAADDTVVVGAFDSEDKCFSYIQREASIIMKNEILSSIEFYIYSSTINTEKVEFIKSISIDYQND